MSVRLAGSTMFARVEEGKQAPLLAFVMPCFQASIRRFQIILLQHMSLLLVRLGGKNKVFGNDTCLAPIDGSDGR
jgi:hypothetical protein